MRSPRSKQFVVSLPVESQQDRFPLLDLPAPSRAMRESAGPPTRLTTRRLGSTPARAVAAATGEAARRTVDRFERARCLPRGSAPSGRADVMQVRVHLSGSLDAALLIKNGVPNCDGSMANSSTSRCSKTTCHSAGARADTAGGRSNGAARRCADCIETPDVAYRVPGSCARLLARFQQLVEAVVR